MYFLHALFLIFFGFQWKGSNLCALFVTLPSANVDWSHSIITLNFSSSITWSMVPRYQSKHCAPPNPGYTKHISNLKPFKVEIFGGNTVCLAENKSISPISCNLLNSVCASALNLSSSFLENYSFSKARADEVPNLASSGNLGAFVGASVGKVDRRTRGIQVLTSQSNNSLDV